jgi:hypothetical protein
LLLKPINAFRQSVKAQADNETFRRMGKMMAHILKEIYPINNEDLPLLTMALIAEHDLAEMENKMRLHTQEGICQNSSGALRKMRILYAASLV